MEEKYLTSDEESKAQCTRKANKCKATSHFNAELCQQADVEVQSTEELYTEEAQIIWEQNTQCCTEQRAEVTPEECMQPQQMNATHQTVPRTLYALQFVGTAIGELKVFLEQVHHHKLPPVEEICLFC